MNELPSAAVSDKAAIRKAAQWLMRLHSGDARTSDREACRRWRDAHPSHEQAWQKAERLAERFGAVPPALGVPVLTRDVKPANRRAVLRTLTALGIATPAAWLAWRHAPWQAGPAEYATATGERRSLTLQDGSRIVLNTGTRIEVAWTNELRLLRLHRGEIFVSTAPDRPGMRRPFIVETPRGRVRALGTRFVVRSDPPAVDPSADLVAVLEQRVEITPRDGGHSTLVPAGQHAYFTHEEVGPRQSNQSLFMAASDGEPGWLHGVLYANDMRLADVIAELSRYRPGWLRCAPEVADLRISGAYQLSDTDAALALLQDTLPVRVVRRSRWWVTVLPATAG